MHLHGCRVPEKFGHRATGVSCLQSLFGIGLLGPIDSYVGVDMEFVSGPWVGFMYSHRHSRPPRTRPLKDRMHRRVQAGRPRECEELLGVRLFRGIGGCRTPGQRGGHLTLEPAGDPACAIPAVIIHTFCAVERRHSSNIIGHGPTTRIPRPPKWPRTGAIAVTPGADSAIVRFDSVTKQYGNADGRPALASLA